MVIVMHLYFCSLLSTYIYPAFSRILPLYRFGEAPMPAGDLREIVRLLRPSPAQFCEVQ